MFKKFIILLFILFTLSIGFVNGGDNTTFHNEYVINESVPVSDDIVYALEDGHFNTSFSDGFNGYCLEYGEEEAKTGDMFYDSSTNYLNHKDEDIGNYLKLYFTDFDGEKYDKVTTQHLIWHFTDGFDGWRVNHTLVDNIKELSKTKKIGDEYSVRVNDSYVKVFLFKVLLSPYEHRQDYFAYKIMFRNLSYENNNFSNVSVDVMNESCDEIIINESVNIDLIVNNSQKNNVDCFNETSNYLNRHITGNLLIKPIVSLILAFLLVCGVQLMNKYYKKK